MKQEIKFKAIVDRIEGSNAILLLGEEQEESIEIPKSFLPYVQESDIVSFRIKVNSRRTKEAKDKVQDMIEKLKDRKLTS